MLPSYEELLGLSIRDFHTPYCLDHALLAEIIEEVKPETPKCLIVGKNALKDIWVWSKHVESFESLPFPLKSRESPMYKLQGVPVHPHKVPRDYSFLLLEGSPEKAVMIYGRTTPRPYDWGQKSPTPSRPRMGPDTVIFGEMCKECRRVP